MRTGLRTNAEDANDQVFPAVLAVSLVFAPLAHADPDSASNNATSMTSS